ncbi:MAG: CrcB family protein [Bifidobacterium sp.]|uniref:fluoride efflux transporter FluC n=1 Tax=Bifidobacterium sp. TaxID=41200 RepID=UPI0039E7F11B
MNAESMLAFILMALCGGVGAVCRFLVDSAVNKRNRLGFPLGTIVVNVTACLLLGLLTGWVASWHSVDAQNVRFILGTGLLGGYSTFSTASVEGYRLIQHHHYLRAIIHTGGMLVVSLGAGMLGLLIASA